MEIFAAPCHAETPTGIPLLRIVQAWAAELIARFGPAPIAVCLEQSRGALLSMLLQFENFVLYPVPPQAAAKLRQAFYSSGSKDDPRDAELLLDILQHHRPHPRQGIAVVEEKIEELTAAHEDFALFEGLPGAGAALAPRLLAAFGSRRERFGSAEEVQTTSGIAPVRNQSGKHEWVHVRWACPKFLRQTFHEFAAFSVRQSVWAGAFYKQKREQGKDHHAAVRALAWLSYGLGSESTDLPAFVVLRSGERNLMGGANLWGSGFLPSTYQGVEFLRSADPIPNLSSPSGVSMKRQTARLDAIRDLNLTRLADQGDPEIATRIASSGDEEQASEKTNKRTAASGRMHRLAATAIHVFLQWGGSLKNR